MLRNVILVGLGLVVLGGIYVARPTFETVSALVLTARDLLFPDKPAPDAETESENAKVPPLSPFAAKFRNSLMIMDDETPQNFDVARLAGVKYFAFYYSASWCPPCRAFTPELVSFYRSFKAFHPEFELIFVSFDNKEDDMLAYMRDDSMRWPAVWYADVDNPDIEAKKYAGQGIPDLVLVDDRGRVISDTYENGKYTDPHHVLDDIQAVMK